MRQLATAISVLLAFQAVALAQSSKVVEVTVPAPSLAKNLLGDLDKQGAAIYLPPGYAASSHRFPVVYLLHGIGDSYDVWLDHFGIPAILDGLIASGRIAPLIVVMPNGRNRYAGSFYMNSPVTGGWEDFIIRDLITYVDANYRTLASPRSRGLAGHSMGGFGAIRIAMRHPDLFGPIYAMSPCCLAPIEDIGHGNPDWRKAINATSLEELGQGAARGEFYPLAIIALLGAMSPNPQKPPFFVEFPLQYRDRELQPVEPAYSSFRDRFPINQIEESRENLRKVKALKIDYGVDDQFAHISEGSSQFSRELAAERIPHVLEVYQGDHRDRLAERLRTVVFPFFNEHFE